MLLPDRAPSDCEIMGLADASPFVQMGMSPLLQTQLGCCVKGKSSLREPCLP